MLKLRNNSLKGVSLLEILIRVTLSVQKFYPER